MNIIPNAHTDVKEERYTTLSEKGIIQAQENDDLFMLVVAAEQATPDMFNDIWRFKLSEDKTNLIKFLKKEKQAPNPERHKLKLEGGYIWPLTRILEHVQSRMILVQSPTGTGKTYSFVMGDFDGILAVPTIAIAQQVSEDHNVDCVHGESDLSQLSLEKNGFVKAVCVYDSLPRLRKELEQRNIHILNLTLGIDEIHQFPSAYGYRRRAVDWLTHESQYFCRVIAFTATPNPLLMASFLKPAATVKFQPDKKHDVVVRFFDRDADICKAAKTLEREHKLDLIIVRHDDRRQIEELSHMKPFAGQCMVFHSKAKETEDGKAIISGRLKKGTKYILTTSLYDCGLSIAPPTRRYGIMVTGRAFVSPESLEQMSSRMRKGRDFVAPAVLGIQSREGKDAPINMAHTPFTIQRKLTECRNNEIAKACFGMIVADLSRSLANTLRLEYDDLDRFLDSQAFYDLNVCKAVGEEGHDVPYQVNVNSIDAKISQVRDRWMTTGNLIGEFAAQDGRFNVVRIAHMAIKGKDETGQVLAESGKARKEARKAAYSEAHDAIKANGSLYVTRLIKGEVESATKDHLDYAIKVREIQNVAEKAGLDSQFKLAGVIELLEEFPVESKTKLTQIVNMVRQAETPIEALREKAKARKDAQEMIHIWDNVQVGDVLTNDDIARLFNEISANGTQTTIIADSPKALRRYIKRVFKVKESRPKKGGKKTARVMKIVSKKPYKAALETCK